MVNIKLSACFKRLNAILTKVNKLMRKTFLSADGYKYFNINRKDVEQKTARYNQAHDH
jgi:hypothetical protein